MFDSIIYIFAGVKNENSHATKFHEIFTDYAKDKNVVVKSIFNSSYKSNDKNIISLLNFYPLKKIGIKSILDFFPNVKKLKSYIKSVATTKKLIIIEDEPWTVFVSIFSLIGLKEKYVSLVYVRIGFKVYLFLSLIVFLICKLFRVKIKFITDSESIYQLAEKYKFSKHIKLMPLPHGK